MGGGGVKASPFRAAQHNTSDPHPSSTLHSPLIALDAIAQSSRLLEMLESQLRSSKAAYHVADPKHVRIAARRVGRGRGAVGRGGERAVAGESPRG